MNSSVDPHQKLILPSLIRLTGIYANSMDLRIFSDRMIQQGLELKRLSLNTEVVAAKADLYGQPFSVIARDVRLQSERIAVEMNGLTEAGEALANYAVAGLARARLCEKYKQTLALMSEGRNRQYLLETFSRTGMELCKALQQLVLGLQRAHDNARNLTRLSVHLPVVAVMFRIESAQSRDGSADRFKGMSNDLIAFSERFSQQLDQLLELIQATLAMFQFSDSSEG